MNSWWSNLHPVNRDYIKIMGPILGAAAFGLLFMFCAVSPAEAQFGTPLIIDGNRYIVNTSRINGAITIESWPMPKTQQRNYNHARKYGSPRSTYSAERPYVFAEPDAKLAAPSALPSGTYLLYRGGLVIGWSRDKASCEYHAKVQGAYCRAR